jgi:hypothetical protein
VTKFLARPAKVVLSALAAPGLIRTINAIAIVSGLIAAAPISASADQTIIESFSLTIAPLVVPDFEGGQQSAMFSTTPFPLFAPTSGTLDTVRAVISGTLTAASIAENPSVKIGLYSPRSSHSGILSIDIDDYNIIAPGMIDLSLSGQSIINDPFQGTGNGELILLVGTVDPPNTTVLQSDGPLTGSVVYLYSPALSASAPEMSTWAMLLVGSAGLGFAGYRSSRKKTAIEL